MSLMSKAGAVFACLYLALFASITWSLPTVLGNSHGSPTLELSNLRAKRGVLPLRLSHYNLTSTATESANFGSTNKSIVNGTDDFHIPHTPYSLRFSISGSYMYLRDAETLLSAIRAEVERELITHGRNARLSSAEYEKTSVGLQIWVQKMPWATVNLAWAELAIVVEGLWLYVHEEGHDHEVFFDVINDEISRQVAFGHIGRPPRLLEPTLKDLQSRV